MAERILIAEDDEDLAFVLREALIRKDYEVEVASTAGRMLDTLKGGGWDLILLDVRLPDMDGLDAIPRCRDLAPDTPAILLHGRPAEVSLGVSRDDSSRSRGRRRKGSATRRLRRNSAWPRGRSRFTCTPSTRSLASAGGSPSVSI